jgi:hypothetical protein
MSDSIISAFAPLVLVSIPAAVFFSFLGPALGTWATTAGEVSLVTSILLMSLVLPTRANSQPLLGWLLFYLAMGLATLALMSVSSTLKEQQRLTGIKLDVDRYWLVIMAVVVATVLLLGLVIGQLVAPEAILRLLSLLNPVWVVIRQILLYIVMIFAYLFFSLVEPMLGDLQDRPSVSPGPFLSPFRPDAVEELAREPIEIPQLFYTALQIILVLGLFGVIAIIFYLAAKRREMHVLRHDKVVESRETILSMDLVQEQISGLLDALRQRRQRTPFVELQPPIDRRKAVREMYQRVLEQALHLKSPRLRQQTPGTYAATLIALCSGASGDVETLTRLYMAARYGTEPPTLDEVRMAEQAFDRISTALQRGRAANTERS